MVTELGTASKETKQTDLKQEVFDNVIVDIGYNG